MGFNQPEGVVKATAFVRTGTHWRAHEIFSSIEDALDLISWSFEPERPSYVYRDDKVFKVVITVEEA